MKQVQTARAFLTEGMNEARKKLDDQTCQKT